MARPSKKALIESLTTHLTEELSVLRAAANAAREGATHEDARAEHQYDTRGLELSYLAGAQAARVHALEAAIETLKTLPVEELPAEAPIRVGAAVEVEGDEGRRTYFLCPVGGGAKLQLGSSPVLVITPSSPVAKAVLRRRTGDVVEIRTKGATREVEVVSVY